MNKKYTAVMCGAILCAVSVWGLVALAAQPCPDGLALGALAVQASVDGKTEPEVSVIPDARLAGLYGGDGCHTWKMCKTFQGHCPGTFMSGCDSWILPPPEGANIDCWSCESDTTGMTCVFDWWLTSDTCVDDSPVDCGTNWWGRCQSKTVCSRILEVGECGTVTKCHNLTPP
jgi:hypothetical protein